MVVSVTQFATGQALVVNKMRRFVLFSSNLRVNAQAIESVNVL
jgi:hypothetical protein